MGYYPKHLHQRRERHRRSVIASAYLCGMVLWHDRGGLWFVKPAMLAFRSRYDAAQIFMSCLAGNDPVIDGVVMYTMIHDELMVGPRR